MECVRAAQRARRYITPAAMGAAADVPLKRDVHAVGDVPQCPVRSVVVMAVPLCSGVSGAPSAVGALLSYLPLLGATANIAAQSSLYHGCRPLESTAPTVSA